MKNRIVTEKVRKIISEKLKGRKLSTETIKKMVESRKGYKHSEETKKKLSIIQKNKILEGLKKLN